MTFHFLGALLSGDTSLPFRRNQGGPENVRALDAGFRTVIGGEGVTAETTQHQRLFSSPFSERATARAYLGSMLSKRKFFFLGRMPKMGIQESGGRSANKNEAPKALASLASL
jgi:hypothetical protein